MLNVIEKKLNNLKLIARFKYDLKPDKEVKLLSRILASNANHNRKQQKKEP